MVMPAEDAGPRRVVITGIGAVTAAGPTAPDYWSALLEGRVCTSPLDAFDAGRPAAAVNPVPTPSAPASRNRRRWMLNMLRRSFVAAGHRTLPAC